MAELTWKQGIIYKYTSPSGKVYIGQTTDPNKRKSKHKQESNNLQTKFSAAICKYGFENFEYEILFETKLTEDLQKLKRVLDAMEIAYISYYNSVNNGYNLSLGGGGSLGYKHTEEWKEEARMRMLGNQNGLGKTKTDEEKQQISERQLGHFISEETKKKIGDKNSKAIIQLDKQGNFIQEFKSAVEASTTLNLSRTGINNCCNGLSKSSGGFIWKHKD